MSSGTLGGVAVLLLAGTLVGLGLYAYFGKGAKAFFQHTYANSFGLFGKAVIVCLLPGGLGLALIGIALTIGKNPVTSNMLIAGLAFVLLGWLVFFVHPKFVQPRWLRENTWTSIPRANGPRKGKRLG